MNTNDNGGEKIPKQKRVNTDNNRNLIANMRKNLRADDYVEVTDLSSSDNNNDDDQYWGDWVIQ